MSPGVDLTPSAREANFCGWYVAIVEHVRDGSTVRVRLLLSEGEHQFVNVAMAGVRTPRTSAKQGEPSEQWGEEVTHMYAIIFLDRVLTHESWDRPSSLRSRGYSNDTSV